jgi:putative transposase
MTNNRKRVKHYCDPGDVHELTFSCYGNRPLLVRDDWLEDLAECINQACDRLSFSLTAFVFMPSHVHLLVFAAAGKPQISDLLGSIKRPFSARIKDRLIAERSNLLDELTARERPGKLAFRFWQEGGGYDRNLQNAATVMKSIEYIHNNPVRAGLCGASIDWYWSSARFYVTDTVSQDARLPRITPLPAWFFGTTTVD